MDGVMQSERKYKTTTLMLSVSEALPKHMQSNVRELTMLQTPIKDRRKGYATKLIKEVCTEADSRGIVLILMPENGLESFYKRFGFKEIQTNPILMARQKHG